MTSLNAPTTPSQMTLEIERLRTGYMDALQTFDLSLKDQLSNTLLHHAILEQLPPEAIECLLEQGADPNLKTIQHYTTFEMAFNGKHAKRYIELLVSHRLDLYQTNAYGKSVVYLSIVKGYFGLLPLFLKHGFDPNTFLYEQCNAAQLLCTFASSVNASYIEALFHHGLDLNHRDENHDTLLHLALLGYHKDVVTFLLEHPDHVDFHAQDKEGVTPLHLAIRKANPEKKWLYPVIQILIEAGADVHLANKDGYTPLDYAKEKDDPSVLTWIEHHLLQANVPNSSHVSNPKLRL